MGIDDSHGLKAACFDLDGTLIDTGPLHVKAEKAALATLGVTQLAPDHPVTFGAGILPGMQMLADHYGFGSAEAVFEAYLPAWEASFEDGLKAMRGADDALRYLDSAGVPMTLVTSGEDEYVDKVVNRFGWSGLFGHRVTLESVMNLKPHPEPYLLAVEQLGLEPGECAGFEDSASGMRSLAAAGLFSVLVKPNADDDLDADLRLNSFEEFDQDLLSSLFET